MAQQGDLERRASKIQAAIRGFVGSLSEILTEDDSFEEETDVIGSVLRQTEAELKNRLEQLKRLRTDTTSTVVASACECDDNLAGSSLHSKRARYAYPEGEVGICRHFCKDHPHVMDITLWETLPAEVVERICAMFPLSKILELLKLCEPWSRLPTATRFRQLCAKAHDDLFGIVMFGEKSLTYHLFIYDSKHEEWSHSKMSSKPFDCVNIRKGSDLLFGRDGGLMCVIPHNLYKYFTSKYPPRILVFNPLTGDKKDIGLSSFTASIEKEMCAVLLQLIMDEELGCYKLILVTLRTKGTRGGVYYSESYDSLSGLWSTLDSGFLYGDGVLRNTRHHVCFDCRLKEICTPAEYGNSHVYPDYVSIYTFVRDHRFKLELVEDFETATEEKLIFKPRILESVWQNGLNEKSTVELAMKLPYGRYEAWLLACTRYVLVITDFPDIDFEDRHHMVLHDRVTGKEVCDIPQILDRHEFHSGNGFMNRDLQFMCDLKWDAVP